jgi:hypothetical protein
MAESPFVSDPAAFTTEWHRHLHNIRAAIVVFTGSLSVQNPKAEDFSEFFIKVHLAGKEVIKWELEHQGESISREDHLRTMAQLEELLMTDEERKRLEDQQW